MYASMLNASGEEFLDPLFGRPLVVLVFSLVVLWLSVQLGAYLRKKLPPPQDDERSDLGLVINSSLTLLALIIGFSFSMAVSRYDQRKNYEEEEANAIGTEYVRADLLPSSDAGKVKELLRQYLDHRLVFFTTRDEQELDRTNNETTQLQDQMWSIVQHAAAAQPTPIIGLVVSGMNDVLNRQGYTQAAWWNRIPVGAWSLMIALGVCCCILVGYGSHQQQRVLIIILPFLLSVAFFLIADIDSPRRGIIRVHPQNLISLQESLHK
jgi:hypothetical protein